MYTFTASPDRDESNRQAAFSTLVDPRLAAEDAVEPASDVLFLSGLPITRERDAFYMSRYVEFIGPWFDLFDNSRRHFSDMVPQLALDNQLLRLACLAAAARQHSLLTSSGEEDAFTYYNDALRTLSVHLQTSPHDPATFASCLLIAHCEMIESKAGNWNLHLKGTCELVMAQGYNGRSGGLAQAVRLLLAPGHRRRLLTVKHSVSGFTAA